MARVSGVWVHRRRGMFFTTLDGKQLSLGVPGPDTPANRAEAEAALRKLIDERLSLITKPVTQPHAICDGPTVTDAVSAFLAKCERRVIRDDLGADSLRFYRLILAHFVTTFGPRPLSSVTGDELEGWASRPDWSRTTRRTYLGLVLTVFRRSGLTPPAVERPSPESRGADCLIPADRWAELLADLRSRSRRGDLAELLEVLRATGARPSEVCFLTVEAVDWPNACVRKTRHKTGKKTGRPRVIHFNVPALAVLARQRVRYGAGLLFRNTKGRAYSPRDVANRLLDASKRLGFPCIAYAARHGFCSDALAMGIPDAVVAALVGHANTTMIHTHYSHISENARLLRAAVERLSGGTAPADPA